MNHSALDSTVKSKIMTENMIVTRANINEVLQTLAAAGYQSKADQLMKWFQTGNRHGQLPKCQYRNIDELVDLIDSHVQQSAKRKAPKHNSKRGRKSKKVATIEVTPAELQTINYVRELFSLGVTLEDVTNTLATHRAAAEKAAAEKAEKATAEREAFAKQYAEIFAQYQILCDAEKAARSYEVTTTAKPTNHRRRRESFTPKESVADIRQTALAEFAAETEQRQNSLF